MALWIDSNNQIHDDMDGAALSLTSWPQDMTQITDEQAATIQAALQAALPPVIDGAGFAQAVKTGVGGILAANALMIAYPAFFPAIQAAQWTDLQALIIDALAKSVLTSAQYTSIKTAAATFNIPVTL